MSKADPTENTTEDVVEKQGILSREVVEEQEVGGVNRLTVVETVYHQVFGEEPAVVESKYDQVLESSEQVYTRRLKVTEEWRPIDIGWVADVGLSLLVIQNREGSFAGQRVNPTDEEREDAAKRIVEIGSWNSYGADVFPHWIISPGGSMRSRPSDSSRLLIRCQHGTAAIVINAFPK